MSEIVIVRRPVVDMRLRATRYLESKFNFETLDMVRLAGEMALVRENFGIFVASQMCLQEIMPVNKEPL
jgi:hypothetical protein